MSPGPDFAIVVKAALTENRKMAIAVGAGIALGVAVHIVYSLLGLAFVISRSIVLFNVIKFIGAAYLIWIGFQALRSKKVTALQAEDPELKQRSVARAVWSGFLTNALNPKATLFFLGLFTQVIQPDTSTGIKLAYAGEMIVVTFLWFTLLATVITRPRVKSLFAQAKHWIDRVLGAVLVALGARVATS